MSACVGILSHCITPVTPVWASRLMLDAGSFKDVVAFKESLNPNQKRIFDYSELVGESIKDGREDDLWAVSSSEEDSDKSAREEEAEEDEEDEEGEEEGEEEALERDTLQETSANSQEQEELQGQGRAEEEAGEGQQEKDEKFSAGSSIKPSDGTSVTLAADHEQRRRASMEGEKAVTVGLEKGVTEGQSKD